MNIINKLKLLLAMAVISVSIQVLADGCNCHSQSCGEESCGEHVTCNKERQRVVPTGKIDPQTLVTEEEEFGRYYHSYKVDTQTIEPLRTLSVPTEIVVIIGTWCPDCHRKTPRFIRIIEEIDNPDIDVTYIAVDRNKKDEEGLAAKYEFSRIPTFIVMQNGQEVGRIVEKPTRSLEQDLVEIFK